MTPVRGFLLLFVVAALTGLGQLCFKKAALADGPFYKKLYNPVFLLGAFLFVCCPVLSSLAAQVIDFSVMYAMTSLNFIFILLLTRVFLKERLDWPKIVGVCVIITGLFVMVLG